MALALRKPEYFWPLAWGAACVVLAGVIVAEISLGEIGAGKDARAPAKAAEAKLLPAFVLAADAQSGGETTSRPLFLPGRRPAPPAAGGESGVLKKGQFVLQGTTIVGDLSFALLKEAATGRVHRVQKGAKVNELTLSEVGATHAVLTLGGDSETLPLLVAKASGAPSPVPAGPFAAPVAAAPAAAPAAPSATAAAPTARVEQPASAVAPQSAAAAAARAARQSRPALPAAPAEPSGPMTFEELARRRLEAATKK